MSKLLQLDFTLALSHIDPKQKQALESKIPSLHQELHERRGPGKDFLGWLDLPSRTSQSYLDEINHTAIKFRELSQDFILLGVGGSYLGARSAVEIHQALCPPDSPRIHYTGYNLSSNALKKLLHSLEGRDFTLNVVSKSGTTLETSIAFQLLLRYMQQRYSPQELRSRILITTDPQQGPLRQLVREYGYPSLAVPGDIGGRYSVLSAVGLFPMAVCGINILHLIQGARQAQEDLSTLDNPAYQYALLRQALPSNKFNIEILATFEPCLAYFAEWWKQLFGESEGKAGLGLFPASVSYTADLHSLGQYLQQGRRQILETFLTTCPSPTSKDSLTDPISQKSMESLQQIAAQSTLQAHSDGGLPCLHIQIPDLQAYTLGYLFYFFQKACAMSGYLLGINPFDQPGVEHYKRNLNHGLKS